MIKLDLKPTQSQLRQFGYISLIGFPLIGLMLWWISGAPLALLYALACLGPVCLLFAVIRPSFLWPLYTTSMVIAFPIGLVVSFTLLALIYYLLFTPVGLMFRLLGRDPLSKGPNPALSSYWIVRKTQPAPASYLRLY